MSRARSHDWLTPRFGAKERAECENAMCITSHPLVSRIGATVLAAGGNACDAALSAAVAQTVVEPHMSTITGVLSMLYFDSALGEYSYVNGSAAAPLQPINHWSGADIPTGRGVAVPGFWAALEAAADRYGSLSLRRIVEPAAEIARTGFPMYPFLFAAAFQNAANLGRSSSGREIFFRSGSLAEIGAPVVQAKAAETLERLGSEGSEFFYRGSFADAFVAIVKEAGGVITTRDLDEYRPRWVTPVRGTYRGFDLIAAPPPDQGGLHLVELLNMVELLDFGMVGHPLESPETMELLIRMHNDVYVAGTRQGDPRSFEIPIDLLASKEYARDRLRLVRMQAPRQSPVPYSGSNHIVVFDGAGNVASLFHSSMSVPWINGLFVKGVSVAAAASHFLRVLPRPGDRISSLAAPNMLAQESRPVLASGSPSQSLLATIVQNIINLIDFGLPIDRSVALPRFGGPGPEIGSTWDVRLGTMIEADVPEQVLMHLEKQRIPHVVVSPWYQLCGSFEAIQRLGPTDPLVACGDPRRTSVPDGF
jgi:gamma-glutamyltranspeptidase/glutathione hydrolase